MTPEMTQTLAKAKKYFATNPDVTSVSVGYKYKNGKKTDEEVLIVGVKEKKKVEAVGEGRVIPEKYSGMTTDVQDRPIVALGVIQTRALSLVGKERQPCPPGFSVGHYNISAGTLGAYVKHGPTDRPFILSNNHVLADSNEGEIGDRILQPGPHDGGNDGDVLAHLSHSVDINFEGDEENGGKKNSASYAWRAYHFPANLLAKLLKCPYRGRTVKQSITQPTPNLVDGSLASVDDIRDVSNDVHDFGPINGFRDLVLGDAVEKVGRTTEHTFGTVEGVNAMTRVEYGNGKVALFDDQLEIRATHGDFSAGGDSGSVILTADGYIGGLLFAGGGGVSVANKISHVISFLGVRL